MFPGRDSGGEQEGMSEARLWRLFPDWQPTLTPDEARYCSRNWVKIMQSRNSRAKKQAMQAASRRDAGGLVSGMPTFDPMWS